MTIIIQINASAPMGVRWLAWPTIRLRKLSIAALSVLLDKPLLLPLKMRSKNGDSIPKDTIEKTIERMMNKK